MARELDPVSHRSDDEVIAEICGVDVPRYACGHVRGFGMGFGYHDPSRRCRACYERDFLRAAFIGAGAVVVAVALLAWRLLAR